MSEQSGTRHAGDCLCGCQFVEGLPGEVVETITVLRFRLPNEREQLVAYSSLDLTDPPAREAGGL